MKIGITLSPGMDHRRFVEEAAMYEQAGVEQFSVSEAYGIDAVSIMGALSIVTKHAVLSSAILPVFSRTPSLIAMTAATLDSLSGGRFELGLGSSGPQVIEGFHGVPYAAPVGRTREVVEICRQVWRRERPLEYQGRYYSVPSRSDSGTGLVRPLKLVGKPVRPRIPIMLAAIGRKNVSLAAEIAESWMPSTYWPEKADEGWGAALAEGLSLRDSHLAPLGLTVRVPLAIGDNIEPQREDALQDLAHYIGGMGTREKNFYNDLVCRYGLVDAAHEVQDHYLDGHKQRAAAAVPAELLDKTSLLGPTERIRARLAAYRRAGVTVLSVTPKVDGLPARIEQIARLREMVADENH